MAKRSRPADVSAADVAQQALPGWKIVRETSLEQPGAAPAAAADAAAADDAAQAADAVLPSQEQLKAKYLGVRGLADSAADRLGASDAAEQADTTLVELEAGPLKKTVAVSKSRKKILWSQG